MTNKGYLKAARAAGCPRGPMGPLLRRRLYRPAKQLLFHAACRACDHPDGPTQIGFGGARGGAKSHAMLAQIALDDCQRQPNLKGPPAAQGRQGRPRGVRGPPHPSHPQPRPRLPPRRGDCHLPQRLAHHPGHFRTNPTSTPTWAWSTTSSASRRPPPSPPPSTKPSPPAAAPPSPAGDPGSTPPPTLGGRARLVQGPLHPAPQRQPRENHAVHPVDHDDAPADTTVATRSIGNVTLTVAETSEYLITASITIDLTASEASPGPPFSAAWCAAAGKAGGAEANVQTAQVLAHVELFWTGFLTTPEIASADPDRTVVQCGVVCRREGRGISAATHPAKHCPW